MQYYVCGKFVFGFDDVTNRGTTASKLQQEGWYGWTNKNSIKMLRIACIVPLYPHAQDAVQLER